MLRHAAAGVALGELAKGVRETRANWGPEVRAYLANCDPPIAFAAPWCAAFVQWVTDRAAVLHHVPNPLDDVALEAYVQSYAQLIRERGWEVPAEEVDTGDLVLFRFGGQRWDHIGIVLVPPGETMAFQTVEGNTNAQGSREGDRIATKARWLNRSYPVLFARWDEETAIEAVAA